MAEKEKIEGLGISGFTLGVLGIIFAGWIGLMICLIGLIFSVIQQKRHKTKTAKVGIILNIIGIFLSIIIIVLYSKITPLLNQLPGA
jgi:hypothetical protein